MRNLTNAELAQILDKDIFHEISEAADALSVECYVVGGYVRDLFLERPSNDIDVVVVGSGIEVASALKKKLGKKAHLSVFRNFGTAQVKYKDTEVEFVGARKESYNRDSRKPIVEDGTLEDDQNRRDFTINAMAVCLNKDRFGELVDPFDGVYDLEDGIIATPLDPDITFSDDPLRMMRCVRFATQLNFQIEDETYAALSRNAERLKIISGERICDEMNKIMLSKHPSSGFYYLKDTGLLDLILPELVAMDKVETRNGKAHKNNYDHTMEVLENVCKHSDNLWLRWAALFHDIGKPRSKRWDNNIGWTFYSHNIIGAKMIPSIHILYIIHINSRLKEKTFRIRILTGAVIIPELRIMNRTDRQLSFQPLLRLLHHLFITSIYAGNRLLPTYLRNHTLQPRLCYQGVIDIQGLGRVQSSHIALACRI